MDCNPSAPSTSKNTNMNIRRQKNNKKTEENKRWNVTAGARAGIITDAGFIGGDRTGINMLLWRKTEALQLDCLRGGGADMSTGVFPSNEAVRCGNARRWFWGSLSTIQKYELEAQDDSFPPAYGKTQHEQQTLRS